MPNPPRPQFPKKKKKVVTKPTTPEEFLDAAVEEEEYGDRWIDSGDIPKALRFYQKAFNYYKSAGSEFSSSSNPRIPGNIANLANPSNTQIATVNEDVYYNYARLVYAVYSKVVKTGEIDLLDPKTAGIPLDGSGVLVYPIGNVLQVVESMVSAVEKSTGRDNIPLDLLFTYAQVLTENGEETENQANLLQALSVYEHVFYKQVEGLNELKVSFGDNNNSTNNEIIDIKDKSSTVNMSAANGTSPTALVDTINGILECINILLELNRDGSTSKITQNDVFDQCIEKYKLMVKGWFSVLQDFYFNGSNDDEAFQAMKLEASQVQETNIAFTQIISTLCESIDQIVELWSSICIYPFPNPQSEVVQIVNALFGIENSTERPESVVIIPNSPDRNMAAGDALFGFAERVGVSDTLKWSAYSKALNFFKQGWTIASDPSTAGVDQTISQLTQHINIPNLSNLFMELPPTSPILKLKLLVARGDTDLLRSNLDTPSAQASLAVLRKNAENMYVSASNLPLVMQQSSSSASGGVQLMGNSPEAQRLKLEIKIKLLLLRGSPEEKEKLLKSTKYKSILRGISDMGGIGLL